MADASRTLVFAVVIVGSISATHAQQKLGPRSFNKAIYGEDDRRDESGVVEQLFREAGASTVALFRHDALHYDMGSNTFRVKQLGTLGEFFWLCEGEKFADQVHRLST